MESVPAALTADADAARDRVQSMLTGDGLTMVYQPIVHLGSGETVGTEALARFTSQPPRGPQMWFADAARAGLLSELERAAVTKALHNLGKLPPQTRLFLNISPTTLATVDLSEVISDEQARRVVLEVSAEASISHRLLEKTLREVRARGMWLAVDDAGRSSASLTQLAALRPEVIKLDSTITRGFQHNVGLRAIARGLIAFSEEADAMVIAEAIETEEERTGLRNMGVKVGQGYLFGYPAQID